MTAFMQEALSLAKKGEFTCAPNPCVGCVIVQNNEIVGRGWHQKTGEAHAEIHALAQAQEKARGATCYVTLEPCVHQGRTGPCVTALIQAGIKRVVVATLDPNPLMAGKGVQALQAAGIAVEVGLLEQEAVQLNQGFFSRMVRKRPFVRAKIASSLDGRIAMANGESQWITSMDARQDGHTWRAKSCAILTGRETVKKDNCRLTARDFHGDFRAPIRMVADTQLQVSPTAALFQEPGPVIVALSEKVSLTQQQTWLTSVANENVRCLPLPEKNAKIDLHALLCWLGGQEINHLLVEAGPTLTGALLQAGLIDELLIYIAPKFLGEEGIAMVKLPGFRQLSEHIPGTFATIDGIGPDLRVVVKTSDFARFGHDAS